MNLRNTIKIAALAGLTTMALPMGAQAALSFGDWTVGPVGPNTGVISGCPTGASCTVLVSGEGFLQQQVDYAAAGGTPAASYIQTIVTDPTAVAANASEVAALPYSDESFVQASGTQSGIAGKQSMSDPGFNFSGSTELYTGWATTEKPAGLANLNIAQGFSDPGVVGVYGDEFASTFELKINLNANGDQTGKSMSIGQIVEMGDGTAANISDIQRFIIEQRTGDIQTAANTGFKLAATSFDANGAPLNGTTGAGVTWGALDDVMVVWLGQKVSDDSTGGGLSQFGYESVSVVDDQGVAADQFASTFSTTTPGIGTQTGLSEAAPFNWDATTFGAAAPTLPEPAIDGTPVTDAGALE